MITSILRENGDAAALIVLLVGLVVVMSCWDLRPLHWFRREWRLMWADSFRPEAEHVEQLVNPALGSTRADPNVAHTEALQYQAGERLRREGKHYIDRAFEPLPTVLKK